MRRRAVAPGRLSPARCEAHRPAPVARHLRRVTGHGFLDRAAPPPHPGRLRDLGDRHDHGPRARSHGPRPAPLNRNIRRITPYPGEITMKKLHHLAAAGGVVMLGLGLGACSSGSSTTAQSGSTTSAHVACPNGTLSFGVEPYDNTS